MHNVLALLRVWAALHLLSNTMAPPHVALSHTFVVQLYGFLLRDAVLQRIILCQHLATEQEKTTDE